MGQQQGNHRLGLVARELNRRGTPESKVLVVQTDPWRYDPATGAKESLIAEVLAELNRSENLTDKAKKLLGRLAKRIDWAKAIKLAVTSSVTLQIPDFDKLVDLVKQKEEDEDSAGSIPRLSLYLPGLSLRLSRVSGL